MKEKHDKETCPECGKPLESKKSWGGLMACYCQFGGKKPTTEQLVKKADSHKK